MRNKPSREERYRQAAEILGEIARKYRIDLDVVRTARKGPAPSFVTALRKEFIERAKDLISRPTIADLLHCDPDTVRYHGSDKYRKQKREYARNEYMARSRAKAGEDRGSDRAVPPG